MLKYLSCTSRELCVLDFMYHVTGGPDGTVLQYMYSVDIVSWLAKYAEQTMNLYKNCINL